MDCPKCNIKLEEEKGKVVSTMNNDPGHLIMTRATCPNCRLSIYINGKIDEE